MSGHDGRGHDHGHSHGISDIKGLNLATVALLNFIITAAEVVGGILAGSLSLISDALHNFSDGISIIVSYLAIKISRKESDAKRTFGYRRATILAALANSSVLIAISVFLFRESYAKLLSPQAIDGGLVVWVALVGLAANIAGVLLLQRGAKGDMNIRSSYLHLLSDALSSIGVVVGGVLIYFFNIYWVDPLLTVLIALYVLKESYEIIRKAVQILMQGAPEDLDVEALVGELETIDAVENVHHVHVWSLDENNVNFEAHVNVTDMLVSQTNGLLREIERTLSRHNINHVTIQFEHKCCDGVAVIKKQG